MNRIWFNRILRPVLEVKEVLQVFGKGYRFFPLKNYDFSPLKDYDFLPLLLVLIYIERTLIEKLRGECVCSDQIKVDCEDYFGIF